MSGFTQTRAAIVTGLEERLHLGAQLCVRRGGEVLTDEAFGEASPGVPMTRAIRSRCGSPPASPSPP